VNLGDHVLIPQMTILFCDARGFTSLAEATDAGGAFAMLGELLQKVSPIMRAHNGFVDKFIGDAVMGLFPGSPADAVEAAVKIQLAVQNLAERDDARPALQVGIGVHTGPTMLGTIGVENRMEATVLSDAVNLAARLEALTRRFGVGTLISDEVVKQLPDPAQVAPRRLGRVARCCCTSPSASSSRTSSGVSRCRQAGRAVWSLAASDGAVSAARRPAEQRLIPSRDGDFLSARRR
jgi:class 3 adenylate cyclase